MPEIIKKRLIEDEMKESYVDYAMSVIVSRALPDVRDGLKPVHRRVLYAMHQLGLQHNKPFRKSATVVGNVMAKLHPHGDVAIYDTLVRMAQNFSLRYPLIDGQGNFGCFTKDTKVALADGRSLSFGELIKEHKKGKKNYTYTINKKGDVEIAKIKNPRLTKKHQKIMKVVLDNGEEIKCTLNHRFMLRDGIYNEAKDLKPGNSLMPVYLRLSTEKDKAKPSLRGYQMVYQPRTNDWVPCHNLADAWNLKHDIYKKSAGRIRHHMDFDKLDNSPENIRRIKWRDHWKMHAAHASELHKNSEYRKKIAEGRKKYWANSENKKVYSRRLSERNKKNWMNPEYRKKMREMISKANKEYIKKHPEVRKELSKRATRTLKKLWKNSEYREKKSSALKIKWKNPEYRKEQAQRMKESSIKIWSNPQHKEFIVKISKERWKDDVYKEKIIGAYKRKWENDPEFRDYFLNILSENGKKANYYRFLAVCKKAFEIYGDINEEYYEKVRFAYNSRKGAGIIRFQVAIKRFFNNDMERLYQELRIAAVKINHKVQKVIFLDEREDVYDLTIEGTHNFALASGVFVHNSIDGDNQAAMRYTESRMAKLAEEILMDIEKETVDFMPNFDGSVEEPSVLPSKVPNLLINGSSGIAVGMATNMPPHNIKEVCDVIIASIENPDLSVHDLMKIMPGPDFPTGGFICGRSGIVNAYNSGRGRLVLRAKTEIEEKTDRKRIIVTEIPYQVNKAAMIENIANLIRDKKIEGISDIRDESDRKGIRVVFELKKGFNENVVLNQLYHNSQLQTTFGVINIALIDGQPKVMNLKDLIMHYIAHRKGVVTKRTQFDLRKAEDKAHILEGLKIALQKIDPVIKTIKSSKDANEAKKQLMSSFNLTDKQAQAILDMRLQRLTSLEQDKINSDYDSTVKLIEKLKDILASEVKILSIIKKELTDLKTGFGDDRRTQIIEEEEEIETEDLIPEEKVVVNVTHSGYIKQQPVKTYKQQRRGGRGVIGTEVKEEDVVEHLFVTSNHNYILFFTNQGNVHWLKAYQIPVGSRYSKGKAIVNLLKLEKDERVTALVPVKEFADEHFLLMATKKGLVKKTSLIEYSRPRKGGIIGITLKPGDELVKVILTPGTLNMMLATKQGMAVKFNEADVMPTGRTSMGVRGIKLKKGDEVVGMEVALESATLLTITEKGYGKRTPIEDYTLIKRGGRGVINMKIIDKNGNVVGIKTVKDGDEVILVSAKGIMIRVPVKDVSVIGRATMGVRVMKLEQGDRVTTLARVTK